MIPEPRPKIVQRTVHLNAFIENNQPWAEMGSAMNKYGLSAIMAVEALQQGEARTPRGAWEQAVNHVFSTPASRNKGCPRDAFLGICGEGMVIGVPEGDYSRSEKNKKYAVQAVVLLRQDKSLADSPSRLWQNIMAGEQKKPNQQMEVVTALWNRGFVR